MTERRLLALLSSLLFVGVLAAYVETMAGSASFWDCGEFIATAYTLGIPHPPATPLYVVLGRVFTLLPLPLTIAQKVNFMSALFGALGVVTLFLVIVDLLKSRRDTASGPLERFVVYGSALVGALFTAWSHTYWTNAVEAEVYSISSFVMGATTLLALRWSRHPEDPGRTRFIYLIIYLLSLGVGFHLGTVLTYPAIALFILLFRNRSFKDADLIIFSFGFLLFLMHVNLKFGGPLAVVCLLAFLVLFVLRWAAGQRFVPIATGLFVLGITIHVFLWIRSAQNPAIDEADPETWGRLMAVLRREQYPPSNPFVRKGSWHFQIVEHFWGYFQMQYELVRSHSGWLSGSRLALLPIFVGLAGVATMAYRQFRSFVLVAGTFLITSLGMILFLNFSDGTRGVQAEVRERDYFYSPAFYFFGVFIGVGAAAVLDACFGGRPAGKRTALDRAGYALGLVVLLAMTGMLYKRYHFEHDRTHERVAWGYGYNMLAGLEEHALIFTNGDNDTFPLWYQQEVESFRKDVRVINLSLLNTAWYLYQLRDNEPKVALTWSDAQIDNLRGDIEGDRVVQPRDFAVRQIVRDNYGKRPIYFAVTIPRDGLLDVEDYLVLEGLVYRLTRERGKDRRDYARIEHNATAVYRYDGILTADGKHDSSIYRDPNQVNLVQNYAGAFVRLGQHAESQAASAADAAARASLYASAVDYYRRALEISPDFDALMVQLGHLYQRMGRSSESIDLYRDLVRRSPEDERWRLYLALAHLTAGQHEEGLAILRELERRVPEDELYTQYLVQTLHELGRHAEARQAVDAWSARHAGRTEMSEFYQAVLAGLTGTILSPDTLVPDGATTP